MRKPKAVIHRRNWNRGQRSPLYDSKIEYGDGTRRYDIHASFEAAQAHVQNLMATRHVELDALSRAASNHTTIKARE